MFVSRTTKRKLYNVVGSTSHNNRNVNTNRLTYRNEIDIFLQGNKQENNQDNNYKTLYLDGYVTYSDGNHYHINITGTFSPSTRPNMTMIEIDNNRTRHESSEKRFNIESDKNVVKIPDEGTFYTMLYRAREECAEVQNLETQNANLQNLLDLGKSELDERDKQITIKDTQITGLTAQIKNDRKEYRISKEKYEELRDLFSTLQIQNNDKDQEIEKKKYEVKELRGELDEFRHANFGHKFHVKEAKLIKQTKELGVDLKKIRELGKLYRDLIRIREDDYDQDKIDNINDKITEIKDEILDEGEIDTNDVHKLFEKCENLAKLQREHENVFKQKNQYRAQIE